MSYPYPQDRSRDSREKGEQPYKDARQAMSEKGAQLQNEAEAFGEEHQAESDEERAQRQEAEAAERLRAVNEDLGEAGHQ